jgi:hypothetical protein
MSLIMPLVTYACEIWALSVQDINNLLVFERQILRNTFEPVHSKEGWRGSSNNELKKLIKGKYVVKYIKAQIIKIWGHINTLKGRKVVKKNADLNRVRVRTKERTKYRWRDEVIYGLKKIKLRI